MFWISNLHFFIKENWICIMTRHHANNILLTRNLPFDSNNCQWNHPLMIPLHCLRAKSNDRTSGQFENKMTLVFVVLVWLRSSTYTVRLLFHSFFTFSSYANKTGWLQNEHKKLFFRQHLVIFLGTCTYKSVKPRKSR